MNEAKNKNILGPGRPCGMRKKIAMIHDGHQARRDQREWRGKMKKAKVEGLGH